MGQWHEMINFGGREVKAEGYTRSKTDI